MVGIEYICRKQKMYMDLNVWKTYRRLLSRQDLRLIGQISSLEAVGVQGEALEVLLRIEQLLRRLRAVGDDERRMLWLPVEGQSVQWLRVVSSQYREDHYLQLRLDESSFLLLTSRKMQATRTVSGDDSLVPLLLRLEGYVSRVVELIEEDAVGYNQYVSCNLNPALRTGSIQRSVLNQFFPTGLFHDINREAALAWFSNPPEPCLFKEMTLRTYLKVRRIAHELIYGPLQGSDVEALSYQSGMQELKRYDLDSPEDFQAWQGAVVGFHGLDVIYARVQLAPYEAPGGVGLALYGNCSIYLSEQVELAMGLTAAGYPPLLDGAERILTILQEQDLIKITPHPSYYLSRGEALTEQKLPDRAELGTKAFNRLVKAIRWDPEVEVLPIRPTE